MRGELFYSTKLLQIELRLANQTGHIKFARINISRFDIV